MQFRLLFFGKDFLCLGEFRQSFAVIRASIRSHIFNTCFKRSLLILLFKKLQLKRDMRLQLPLQDENADEDATQLHVVSAQNLKRKAAR